MLVRGLHTATSRKKLTENIGTKLIYIHVPCFNDDTMRVILNLRNKIIDLEIKIYEKTSYAIIFHCNPFHMGTCLKQCFSVTIGGLIRIYISTYGRASHLLS